MFLLYFLLRKLNVFNIVLFFLAIILAILLWADNPLFYSYGEERMSNPTRTPTPTAIPTPTPTPMPKPSMLVIPKLGVQAPVDYVGMDEEGKMDVPTVDTHVAWFSLGFRPGEIGNAVMAGHYDTTNAVPSIFYHLNQLQPGDEIFVIDEFGQQKKFVVRENVEYDLNNVPLQSIFGYSDKPRLNLITCSGWFNNSINSYSHRTVVFTELVE